MEISIITKVSSSEILIKSQFVMRPYSNSHNYVDIWRSIDDNSYTSLSELYGRNARGGDGSSDSMISYHPTSSGQQYEEPRRPFAIDKPDVKKGTKLSYKIYVGLCSGNQISIGAHDCTNPNSKSPEHLIIRELAPAPEKARDVAKFPGGSIIGTKYEWSNYRYDIGGVPGYNNNIDHFRPTTIYIDYTTTRDNSALFISTQFLIRPHSNSHNYVDIWRSEEGNAFKSLSQMYGNKFAHSDGLISQHPESSHTHYEECRQPFVLDTPNRPKGTTFTYKVYIGLWSGSTMTIGAHDSSNPNSRSPEFITVQEIADLGTTAQS